MQKGERENKYYTLKYRLEKENYCTVEKIKDRNKLT